MDEVEKELHELKEKLQKEQEFCKQEREVQHNRYNKGRVIGLFGHITPIIHINTFRAHRTLIQFLHALDKSSH